MTEKETFTFYLTQEEKEKLEKMAKAQDESKARVLRKLIQKAKA